MWGSNSTENVEMLNKVIHSVFEIQGKSYYHRFSVFVFPSRGERRKSKHQPRLLFKGTKAPDIFHFKMKGIECNWKERKTHVIIIVRQGEKNWINRILRVVRWKIEFMASGVIKQDNSVVEVVEGVFWSFLNVMPINRELLNNTGKRKNKTRKKKARIFHYV